MPAMNKRLQGFLDQQADDLAKQRAGVKRVVDLQALRQLASIGCTIEEIAQALGYSVAWLNKERERNPAAEMALQEGYANIRQSLRRAQIDVALKGNPQMLIWLGKQLLGQSDKQVTESKTEINITVQRAMEEVRNMPRQALLESLRLLEQAGGNPSQVTEAEYTEEEE